MRSVGGHAVILARRPIAIYDVDLIAVGLITAAMVGVYMLAIRPQQQQAASARTTMTSVQAVESEIARMSEKLQGLREQTKKLQTALEAQLARTPTVRDRNALINDIFAIAESVGLEVDGVAPSAPDEQGSIVLNDVEIQARGETRSLIALLDRLARDKPYHSIRSFSVTGDGDRDAHRRKISLTVRLFLLPEEGALVAEASP
ncbi:MAG: hypothetical protein D6744_07815 [Planctomycetota bacterium]|nr:MAG: hypothetical protein D6744_07815 [Planctomycetota bacterium]